MERKDNEDGIEAELCVEAENHMQAVELAQSQFLHAVLDAISFQRHTSMTVTAWTLILKAEKGLPKRRFILARNTAHKDKCFIDGQSAFEVQRILEGSMPLALRWMRNSYRPIPIFDEFIYLWLALENISGSVQKHTLCDQCRNPVRCEACKTFPSHPASDPDAALKIIRALVEKITESSFSRTKRTNNRIGF